MSILITGVAGFIGAAVAKKLLVEGQTVYGCDDINSYYDPALKQARLDELFSLGGESFIFEKLDIANRPALEKFFQTAHPTCVIHLAAQASVRYALKKTEPYLHSNLVGQFNVLDIAKEFQASHPSHLKHVLYASSSSVYGGNEKVPFEEEDDVSHPQSLYAATKRANEMVAYSYATMFQLPLSALRFFTVYGPQGRPDMAPMLFAKAILAEEEIPLFNKGDLWRDFTYIDDVVEGVTRLIPHPPTDTTPHEIYNIGNNNPVKMLDFVTEMEKAFGKKAIVDLQPCPATEVYKTYASTDKLAKKIGWAPSTPLSAGLAKFATWYKTYQ